MENFRDTFQMFESSEYRKYISQVNTGWLSQIRNWTNFITLTFKDECSIDWALLKFRELIRIVNSDLCGDHYIRKCGHSYFSYVCGIEYQQRGTPHFHMVTDRPLNYHLFWKYWYQHNGYIKTEQLFSNDDRQNVINYSLKYATKDGEALIWLNPKPDWKPIGFTLPRWWIEPYSAFRELPETSGDINGLRIH